MSEAISQEIEQNKEPEYLSQKEYEVKMYFEWLDRVEARIQEHRQKMAEYQGINPALYVPSYKPWEAPGLTDGQRRELYLNHELEAFYETHDSFSPAAYLAVYSTQKAIELDDFKCDYMGHSERMGWFREIGPGSNQTPYDVQFDYDIGRLNHFTENGMLVHVRETSDPAARTREQKLFIVTHNLLNGEQSQYYAESHTDEYRSQGLGASLNETLVLKQRRLSAVPGGQGIDTDNQFAVRLQEETTRFATRALPKLQVTPTGYLFKPKGLVGYESLLPIRELDHQRHLLGQFALQAGKPLNDRGAIESEQLHLSIAG
jgi:hypothetical protein